MIYDLKQGYKHDHSRNNGDIRPTGGISATAETTGIYELEQGYRGPINKNLQSGSRRPIIDPPDLRHWYQPPHVRSTQKKTWFFQGLEYFLFSSDIWMTFREQQVGKETRHDTHSGWRVRQCALDLSSFPQFPFPLEQTGKEAVNRCVCVVQYM